MALFRRKAKEQAADEADVTTEVEQAGDEVEEPGAEAADDSPAVADPAPDDEDQPSRLPRPFDLDRSQGPFDRSEVTSLEGLLDFDSIAIIPQPGMELRLDVDDAGQEITGLTAVIEGAACQLQAFAAPKSRGVWDDIRDEIADNLLAGGGTAEEKLGPLGIELHTRMPTRGADGRTTYAPARFVGIDGPRWFLRVVLSGNAAIDEAMGDHLLQFVRHSVVTRGGEPRAPREMLPLQIPQDIQDQAEAQAEAAAQEPATETADDFKPFERGPEITEVR